MAHGGELPAGEHAEFEEEERKHSGEEVPEERLHPHVADRPGEESDGQSSDEKQHRPPEDDLAQRLAHPAPAQALGQKQADDDAGDLQHGEQCRDVSLEGDGGCLEEDNRRGEGDERRRSIVGRQGTAVDTSEWREHPEDTEGRNRDEDAQHQGGDERPGDFSGGCLAQRDTALDADGQEEVHRGGLVDRVGQSKVRPQRHGDEAQDKGKDGG